jgi:hypothetical protein
MAKPTIFRITPFDATIGTTISFEWGGRSASSNKIEIRERDSSDSSTAVYSGVYTSYKGKHVIPANVLENGKTYKIRLRVETYAGYSAESEDPSDYSDNVIFYCFATPTFGFNGLKTLTELQSESLTANEVNASNITLSLVYSQANGEQLNSWTAFLCDSSYGVQQSTDLMYYASKTQTSFSGLSDRATMYVRATGTTVNGMEVDTGYIPIYVYYELPTAFINFEVTNNKSEGHIDLKSSIVALLGTSGDGSEIKYIGTDDLKCADLSGNYVIYGINADTNGSISITSDFTLYFKARDIKVMSKDYEGEFKMPSTGIDDETESLAEILLYNSFLTLTDSKTGYRYSFTLWKTEVGTTDQYQVFVYCNQPNHEFGLWSTSFSAIPSGSYLYLMVQRQNNTMTLKTLVKGE